MIIFTLGVLAILAGAVIAIWLDVMLGLKIIFTSLVATLGLLVVVGMIYGALADNYNAVADEKNKEPDIDK